MLLGRPCEPRNHAFFFRQCGSVPSLCIRCGHDPPHFLRGWTGRAALVRDVAWAGGPPGRGHSISTGAVHAFGDRTTVPERVTCPRLEWLAPGRAEFTRRETVVARRIRPWRWAGLSETVWKGTLKTVVQRPSFRLTIRLAPMPSCGAAFSPYPAEEATAATRPENFTALVGLRRIRSGQYLASCESMLRWMLLRARYEIGSSLDVVQVHVGGIKGTAL